MTCDQKVKRPWTAEPTEKVFEIFIKTTPERLWEAIVDPALRQRYNFGASASSDWTPGSHYELYGGWPMILSGLKTLLESGESLTTPGSLRYS